MSSSKGASRKRHKKFTKRHHKRILKEKMWKILKSDPSDGILKYKVNRSTDRSVFYCPYIPLINGRVEV